MSGDAHVRICESLGVQFPRATRLFVAINGVGALIQRGGRAVAGMLTIATAGGS